MIAPVVTEGNRAIALDPHLSLRKLVERRVRNCKPINELPETFSDDEFDAEKAEQLAGRMPETAILKREYDTLNAAVFDASDERTIREAMAFMIAAMPSAQNSVTVEYANMLASLMSPEEEASSNAEQTGVAGYSAAVLILTVREVVATKTFAPSIAEVLDIARRQRSRIRQAMHLTNRLLRCRAAVEKRLGLSEDSNEMPS